MDVKEVREAASGIWSNCLPTQKPCVGAHLVHQHEDCGKPGWTRPREQSCMGLETGQTTEHLDFSLHRVGCAD